MSTQTTLLSIVDRKHLYAITDAARAVLQSARAFLDATRFGKGTPLSDDIYWRWEGGLHALRRCIADANGFRLRKRYLATEEETTTYAALRTLARDVGESTLPPPTAGALPPLPNEESIAYLAAFVAAVERFLPTDATAPTSEPQPAPSVPPPAPAPPPVPTRQEQIAAMVDSWGPDDWERTTPLVRVLLNYMKSRERAALSELCPAVWGNDCSDVSDSARNTLTSKANGFLVKQGSKWGLHKVRSEPVLRWE